MNIAHKKMRIVEADTQEELVAYYNWLLGAIDAHNKDDDTSDHLAISRLSNPYEHFHKIKQTWRKDQWEEKFADELSHLVRGDAVVVQRANFEFIAYDEKCSYNGCGYYYYHWFHKWKVQTYDPAATKELIIRDRTPPCDEEKNEHYRVMVRFDVMSKFDADNRDRVKYEPTDQEIEAYGQTLKEQNAQRNKEIIESWK